MRNFNKKHAIENSQITRKGRSTAVKRGVISTINEFSNKANTIAKSPNLLSATPEKHDQMLKGASSPPQEHNSTSNTITETSGEKHSK